MSRWSARRGQVEPFAAIVAVFAVGIGLTVYAGALDATLPGGGDRNAARPALDSVREHVGRAGVLDPGRLAGAETVAPGGYHLNATLEAAGRQWHAGPTPPATAREATERVSVRVAPGRVRPGRLEVRVWR